MRILRAIQPGAKVALVFLLTLSLATILTLSIPRAAHAEGFLLPTTRCIIQKVLAADCQQAKAPSDSSQGQGTGQSSGNGNGSSVQPAQQPTTSGDQQSSSAPQFEPIAGPEGQVATLPAIEEVPTKRLINVSHIDESEYLAYFNASNKYAVQRAQSATLGQEIVQPGPEGWKIVGIAWYWWLIVISGSTVAAWYVVNKYRHQAVK